MELDRIYNKSCQRMPELPDGSIDTILTSCPYWGLRDYGEDVREIWGGDPDCEHNWKDTTYVRNNDQTAGSKQRSNKGSVGRDEPVQNAFCQKCGAWYGQLGLEPTFQLYLDHMMIVCAEIKRVLKKTGSFWLNMGDTYGGSCGGHGDTGLFTNSKRRKTAECMYNTLKPQRHTMAKCLLGIPSRLRNRLVDEQGWTCRNTVIWAKPNSMPSSKKDALTPSYEFLFHFVKNIKPQYYWNEKTGLMTDRKPKELKENIDWEWRECPKCSGAGKIIQGIKAGDDDFGIVLSEKGPETCPRCKGTGKIKHSFWHSLGYWYDLDAIREPYTEPLNRWGGNKIEIPKKTKWRSPEEKAKWQASVKQKTSRPYSAGKNPGDVWTIPTQPRPEAHFATFPDKLCTKPILATCPAEICKKCGKARVRITQTSYRKHRPSAGDDLRSRNEDKLAQARGHGGWQGNNLLAEYETVGWTDCGCNAGWDSGVLLDLFAGKGTALIMAKKLGRHYVGYDSKKEYCEKLIKPALEEIDPLFNWKTPSLQAREKK